MKQTRNTAHSPIKRGVTWLIGMALCILPPVSCILTYFPIWAARGGEYVVSGVTVLLLTVAALPLYRAAKELLRSPAGYTVWLILFIIFFTMSKIAQQMAVVSLVGFVGNLLGAVFFRLSRGGVSESED